MAVFMTADADWGDRKRIGIGVGRPSNDAIGAALTFSGESMLERFPEVLQSPDYMQWQTSICPIQRLAMDNEGVVGILTREIRAISRDCHDIDGGRNSHAFL
jgi:hypothetical protein